MSRPTSDCCIAMPVARAVIRTDEPVPTALDFCQHHFVEHHDALVHHPNFIVIVVLDEDGQPVPLTEAKDLV